MTYDRHAYCKRLGVRIIANLVVLSTVLLAFGVAFAQEGRLRVGFEIPVQLDPAFALKFITQPGEAVFFNNLTVLHNRTAFEDSEIESEKRHLLRLWLVAHEPRPVCDNLRIYEGRGIDKQEGRSTYFDGDLAYSRFDDDDARM